MAVRRHLPLGFSAAGSLSADHRGRMISRVAAIGYVGSVSGPLVIGGLAELIGLPSALTLPATLAFVVALRAGALSPQRATRRQSLRPATEGAR